MNDVFTQEGIVTYCWLLLNIDVGSYYIRRLFWLMGLPLYILIKLYLRLNGVYTYSPKAR